VGSRGPGQRSIPRLRRRAGGRYDGGRARLLEAGVAVGIRGIVWSVARMGASDRKPRRSSGERWAIMGRWTLSIACSTIWPAHRSERRSIRIATPTQPSTTGCAGDPAREPGRSSSSSAAPGALAGRRGSRLRGLSILWGSLHVRAVAFTGALDEPGSARPRRALRVDRPSHPRRVGSRGRDHPLERVPDASRRIDSLVEPDPDEG
jgi:hypothetical protein